MLKTWSFWKTFFTAYLALVGGIWGLVEAYTYFESNSLKQSLGSYWWIYYYVVPLFIAILFAVWMNSSETREAESLDQHNRRVMLNHVENFWVKGILEKSLHGAALLELGIKEDPTAINYPWTIKRESINETLPAGKSMLEIFKEIGADRSLLILGAPGSGKTTMLLELARQLIEYARNDETEPIPVIFNLSSWTEKQSFANWLIEQLNIVYFVPKKTASQWVSENKMLLLLDGLDEIKQDYRSKCVEAINQFRNKNGLTSLVVCSRIEEYQAIHTKLSLEGAISLQPLTPKQVSFYFNKLGKSLANVKELLKRDKELRELTETPLMLSIMTLAYKDKKTEELPNSQNVEDGRKHLFNAYIGRMFERSTKLVDPSFTKQKTLQYLSRLAFKMIQLDQAPILVERFQPNWFDTKKQKIVYRVSVGFIEGIFVTLTFALITNSWLGILLGLIVWFISIFFDREIKTVDTLRWSWKGAFSGMKSSLVGAAVPGLIFGLIVGYLKGWYQGLTIGVGSFLAFGLVQGLNQAFNDGLIGEQLQEISSPGQGVRSSIKNAFVSFIASSIIFGSLFGMLGKILTGIGFGLTFFYIYGISAVIQHYTLRLIFAAYDLLPWNIFSFLEYSTELIILRRVGGSYIFVHRLLMEHFAEMEVEKP